MLNATSHYADETLIMKPRLLDHSVDRQEFIDHVRATIAYLETGREQIVASMELVDATHLPEPPTLVSQSSSATLSWGAFLVPTGPMLRKL